MPLKLQDIQRRFSLGYNDALEIQALLAENEELRQFREMIYQFGMRNNTDTLIGHPVLKWQMSIQYGTAKTTSYGKTPKDVSERALKWLNKKRHQDELPMTDFVYLDGYGQPVLCHKWGDDWWLFRWLNKRHEWTSDFKLTEEEVKTLPHNLSIEHQKCYETKSWQLEEEPNAKN